MRSVRVPHLVITLLLGTLVPGCASDVIDEPVASSQHASQCGPSDDSQAVESYDGTLGVTPAFVKRAERHVGWHFRSGCSGTLISDDLYLSAGHCGYVVGEMVSFDFQDRADGTSRPVHDYPVTQVVEQEYNASWDYAIVRLGGSPGREYGHAIVAPIDPPVGTLLTIIGHPDRGPKRVATGPLVGYNSSLGLTFFDHQVDSEGGDSGAGVLDPNGVLVGVHTNSGCISNNPQSSNSGMRMSLLVNQSSTLAALSRTKLVWSNTDGRISIWRVAYDGTFLFPAQEHGPFEGWSPVSVEGNHILWRHTSGKISLWTIDDYGNRVHVTEHGPISGWTGVGYAQNRILWVHTSGKAAIWNVDDVGNQLSHAEFGPFAGWTPVNYANNRLLWRQASGKISLWNMTDDNQMTGFHEYGPYAGWSPISYYNGKLLWKNTNGKSSQWTLDRDGVFVEDQVDGPFAGWTVQDAADGHLLWRNVDGRASYWRTDDKGAQTGYKEYGPYAGWTPMFTAGGRP